MKFGNKIDKLFSSHLKLLEKFVTNADLSQTFFSNIEQLIQAESIQISTEQNYTQLKSLDHYLNQLISVFENDVEVKELGILFIDDLHKLYLSLNEDDKLFIKFFIKILIYIMHKDPIEKASKCFKFLNISVDDFPACLDQRLLEQIKNLLESP
jgi:hypothetical protein